MWWHQHNLCFRRPIEEDYSSADVEEKVATIAETDESAESEGVIDSHKRREILSRRPSYRKILNELSSDVPGVPKIEEEKSEEEGTPPNIATMAVPTSIYQTSTGQYNEETELAPSHMAGKWQSWTRTQTPNPMLFLHLPCVGSREAARECQCRRRKKEYVKCLESRVAMLEVQNKKLIEELETLKDICSPKTD
uniref:cAMP-responsive element modulator n=1 Tax=Mandrillus leucophaeus TaxID=9568 RepID=A0A2K5YK17_MANLE